jgi:hypothetical protein
VLGSASHSGFGKEPAIVVGNSILRVSSGFPVCLAVYLPCSAGEVQKTKVDWGAFCAVGFRIGLRSLNKPVTGARYHQSLWPSVIGRPQGN